MHRQRNARRSGVQETNENKISFHKTVDNSATPSTVPHAPPPLPVRSRPSPAGGTNPVVVSLMTDAGTLGAAAQRAHQTTGAALEDVLEVETERTRSELRSVGRLHG